MVPLLGLGTADTETADSPNPLAFIRTLPTRCDWTKDGLRTGCVETLTAGERSEIVSSAADSGV